MLYKKAYAKINLGLEVVGKRRDGYHDLKMFNVAIDLYDELFFSLDKDLIVESDLEFTEIKNNLIYKTAKLIKERYNVQKGAKIELVKNIRIGGGLAGGSSNAAITIIALNKLWDLNLSLEAMLNIAKEIGSDVPFCLYGKPAIVEGVGDIITLYPFNKEIYFVLVFPDFTCSTKEIFAKHELKKESNAFDKLLSTLEKQDINLIGESIFNDLEVTVDKLLIKENKPINRIKTALIASGALGAAMTGSGSTIYGITDSLENAKIIKEKLDKQLQKVEISITKIRK